MDLPFFQKATAESEIKKKDLSERITDNSLDKFQTLPSFESYSFSQDYDPSSTYKSWESGWIVFKRKTVYWGFSMLITKML